VQLVGTIDSDRIEVTVIRSCACPHAAIEITYTAIAGMSPEVRKLKDAIFFTRIPDKKRQIISATLIGYFNWRPPAQPARTLTVTELKRFQVKYVVAH
jgi:hypothetical protein